MTTDDPANDGDSSLTLADTLAETVTTLSKAVEEITIKPFPKIYCDKAVQTELLELGLDLEPLDSKVLARPAEPISTPASTSASSFTSFFTSESDSAFEAEPESKTEPSPSCESTPTRNTPAAQSESTVPVSTSLLDISPIQPTTKVDCLFHAVDNVKGSGSMEKIVVNPDEETERSLTPGSACAPLSSS